MIKEVTVVESANNISIPVERVISFEKSISEKDQTIGAHKETINNLKLQIEKLEAADDKVLDDQKVAVVRDTSVSNGRCEECGYSSDRNLNRTTCYNCDRKLKIRKAKFEVVEYRNLEDVITDIRKEESKKIGVDNNDLQNKLNKSEFEFSKLKTEVTNLENVQAQALTDAKRHVREGYQKELDASERKVKELVEEIQKLEENKTDEVVEAARKQEIIDLKEAVTELTEQIEESKKYPKLAKYWQRVAARSETKRLEADKKAKSSRIERISNNYPKVAEKQSEKWWNKGKFAKSNDKNGSPYILGGGLWSACMPW